jgi:acylphosphatase
MPTVHLLIKGKVQGVFYRATAKKVAESAGLTGWIKNTKNGNVEAMVTGAAEKLEQFIEWCRQGPHGAVVQDVQENKQEETSFKDFSISR